MKLFLLTFLNGLTLAALYFLVASGFTLVFGLMRNVNLAHGSLYLLGAYIGFSAIQWTGSWVFGVAAGFVRSEEHTSELQSLMRISYAVLCLKKKKKSCELTDLSTS